METKPKTKPKTIAEKKADIKAQIISNSKDAKWAKEMLDNLIFLQKQEDVEPVELIVPTKEIKETIDFGACRISRTIRGFLFEAKGGMYTFVESRMSAVAAMSHTLFELHDKERNEEEEELYQSFQNAVTVIFQALIFASLDESMVFGIAADILKRFNDYYGARQEIPHEETEEDIASNNEDAQIAEGIAVIAETPIPPEIR